MTYFCVQAIPGRKEWPLTKECIEASDIGTDYQLFLQEEGEFHRDFFLRIMQAMYDSGEALCVRFEDDLSGVNRHIRYNVESWPALRSPQFGVGWLMSPGGHRGTQDKWHQGLLHMSQGVVLRREDILPMTEGVRKYWEVVDTSRAFTPDLALTYAAQRMGKLTCVHNPSLVRHNEGGESLLGNTHHPQHDSDCGSFSLDWRRP
jgi:hypothetical protein